MLYPSVRLSSWLICVSLVKPFRASRDAQTVQHLQVVPADTHNTATCHIVTATSVWKKGDFRLQNPVKTSSIFIFKLTILVGDPYRGASLFAVRIPL